MEDLMVQPMTEWLMDVRIHRLDRCTLLAWLTAALEHPRFHFVANVNAHALNMAWKRKAFRTALNTADICFVDGYGIIMAAKLCRMRLGMRLTLADWMPSFFGYCAARGIPLFWLGDTDEVGAAFETWIRRHYPDLPFAGRHHGFFSRESEENDYVLEMINASGAKVLLVGMSMPIQEEWIVANRARLTSVRLALAAGGYARIATGIIPRGPRWMTDHGLEWFYRFLQQPGYTWKRYWLGNPLFLLRVLGWRHGLIKPR